MLVQQVLGHLRVECGLAVVHAMGIAARAALRESVWVECCSRMSLAECRCHLCACCWHGCCAAVEGAARLRLALAHRPLEDY